MKKHIHTLIINGINGNSKKYNYNFGKTRDIELILSETGVSITAILTNLYDKAEMLSGDSYLFPDAIKKAMLLYLLKYNKSLGVCSITVKIDADEETLYFDRAVRPPIYTMINGDLIRSVPKGLTNVSVIDYLLNTPKSKYDKRIAALFSLLFSKSKNYETERFVYLWTSFNGIYNWISDHVAKANGIERYRQEYKQILCFQQFIGVGNSTIEENDKSPIAHSAISILYGLNADQTAVNNIKSGKTGKRIESVLKKPSGEKYNLTGYGYLLTQLAYYFRCKIIHGSKPLYLFAYSDDRELHALKIINELLEEYIDMNLPLLFDEHYIKNAIVPKAHTIMLK